MISYGDQEEYWRDPDDVPQGNEPGMWPEQCTKCEKPGKYTTKDGILLCTACYRKHDVINN